MAEKKKGQIKSVGLKSVLSGYNDDGTVDIDVLKTGSYLRSSWFGEYEFEITREQLESMSRNFERNVIGNKLTFNYHHERRENFGVPRSFSIEERSSKAFPGVTYSVLVANTALTPKGRADIDEGQVLNFSSEVEWDYTHRELMRVPAYDPQTGLPLLDDSGAAIFDKVKVKYGATLVGGAVTNYPFITDLNPEGIGGNVSLFSQDAKQSPDDSLVVAFNPPTDLEQEQLAAGSGQSQKPIVLDLVELSEVTIAKLFGKDPNRIIKCGNRIYDANDFEPGDVSLPDSAFEVVNEEKTSKGNIVKILQKPRRQSDTSELGVSPDTGMNLYNSGDPNRHVNQNENMAQQGASPIAEGARDSSNEQEVPMADNTQLPANPDDSASPLATLNAEQEAFVASLIAANSAEQAAQFNSQMSALKEQFATLQTDNGALKAQLELAETEKKAARLAAFRLESQKFADEVCNGQLTPGSKASFLGVIRENVDAVFKIDGVDGNVLAFCAKLFGDFELVESTLAEDSENGTQVLSNPVADNTDSQPIRPKSLDEILASMNVSRSDLQRNIGSSGISLGAPPRADNLAADSAAKH